MNKAELIYFLKKLADNMVCDEDRKLLLEWIDKIDKTAWVELISKL